MFRLLPLSLVAIAACAGGDASKGPEAGPEVASEPGCAELLAFNRTDAAELASSLAAEFANAAGVDQWAEENGRKPALRFRRFRNMTPERIELKPLAGDLQKAMAESGRVEILVEAGASLHAIHEEQDKAILSDEGPEIGHERAADLVAAMSIVSMDDATPTERIRYYRAEVELIAADNGRKLWIGEAEVKKMCEQPAPEAAPEE